MSVALAVTKPKGILQSLIRPCRQEGCQGTVDSPYMSLGKILSASRSVLFLLHNTNRFGMKNCKFSTAEIIAILISQQLLLVKNVKWRSAEWCLAAGVFTSYLKNGFRWTGTRLSLARIRFVSRHVFRSFDYLPRGWAKAVVYSKLLQNTAAS